jgi:TRAP-type C4-dicarboxylate transport system substrate-binding protein
LKVRISGNQEAPYWSALGASPISQPATEINQNLANGVIDGIAIDAASILSFKLQEVGKHVTVGVPAQGISFSLLMNKRVYAALSAQEKQWVDRAGGEAFSVDGATRAAQEDKAAMEAVRKAGIEVIQMPAEETRRMSEALRAEVEKFRAAKFRTGITGAQAYDLIRGR